DLLKDKKQGAAKGEAWLGGVGLGMGAPAGGGGAGSLRGLRGQVPLPPPYAPSTSQSYDPYALVQTGPGLPRWHWTTLPLHWSGPVAASQRLRLYLLSPTANLVLAFVR